MGTQKVADLLLHSRCKGDPLWTGFPCNHCLQACIQWAYQRLSASHRVFEALSLFAYWRVSVCRRLLTCYDDPLTQLFLASSGRAS